MNQPGSGVAAIPCWNEAVTLGPVVAEVRARMPLVLVAVAGPDAGVRGGERPGLCL